MSWESYDRNLDVTKKGYEEAKKNQGKFEEIPDGTYEVSLEDIYCTITKETNKPMVVIIYKIIHGEYTGRLIYHNNVIDTGQKIHILINHLRSLKLDVDDFESYTQLERIIDKLSLDKYEYFLKKLKNKKGRTVYKVAECFEANRFKEMTEDEMDDMPF